MIDYKVVGSNLSEQIERTRCEISSLEGEKFRLFVEPTLQFVRLFISLSLSIHKLARKM